MYLIVGTQQNLSPRFQSNAPAKTESASSAPKEADQDALATRQAADVPAPSVSSAQPLREAPTRATTTAQSAAPPQMVRPVVAISSRGYFEFFRSPGFWLMLFSGVLLGLILRRVFM